MSKHPRLPLPDFGNPDIFEDMEPPPRLYHYTDTAGFLGIVESGVVLRATHHRYLNDGGEVRFGLGIASDVLDEMSPHIGDSVRKLVEAKMSEILADDSFVACLSEDYSVLSQWRAYAKSGAGYCLGLRSTERVVSYGDDASHWANHLVKCRYGTEENKAYFRARFARKIERGAGARSVAGYDEWLASELAEVAWRGAHQAKHHHFAEEKEWRFIVDGPGYATKFRVSARGLTPFLETERLELEEVWIGPGVGPGPEIAKQTAHRLMKQRGLDARVESWASPYIGDR
jgi:hypothetical protein